MAKVDTWMPLYIAAYMADTMDLTTLEHGAYFLLLINMWKAGGKLPYDPKRLATLTRLGREWARIGEPLVKRFFVVKEGGFISQNKLSETLLAAQARVEQKRLAGIESGKKRQHKPNGCSTDVPTEHPTQAEQNPQRNRTLLSPPTGGEGDPSPPGGPPPHFPPSAPNPKPLMTQEQVNAIRQRKFDAENAAFAARPRPDGPD